MEDVEKDLVLLGASAVEDKLQERVPEVLSLFVEAGIKVWMLTGDKMETAESIGLSCNLIRPDYLILRLESQNEDIQKLQTSMQNAKVENRKVAMVLDGQFFKVITSSPRRKLEYLALFLKCDSVICCRMTPNQKAEVVQLMQRFTNKVTLAVGDGGNDVNMIQKADIGVGIYGSEGMQAVNASDFAVNEFQGLEVLLLHHGRWLYLRMGEMLLYFFYKTIVYTMPQFYFIILNAYSARSQFEDWYMTGFNMIISSLPLTVKAILDKDFDHREIRKTKSNLGSGPPSYELVTHSSLLSLSPYIYSRGLNNLLFNSKTYFKWMGRGMLDSFIVWAVSVQAFSGGAWNQHGHSVDYWLVSITMFSFMYSVGFVDTSAHHA